MSGIQNLASTEELPHEEKEGTPTVSGDGERAVKLARSGAMLETMSWIVYNLYLLWGSLALCTLIGTCTRTSHL